MRRAFRCPEQRRQRRSDGTFSLAGIRFEIPGQYRHLERVTDAYARWNLQAVELLDPHTLAPLCPVYPLDKAANADGKRRRLAATPAEEPGASAPTESGLPPLLDKYIRDYAATGRPPRLPAQIIQDRRVDLMNKNLLAVAARRELPQLDEKLYLEVFGSPPASPAKVSH